MQKKWCRERRGGGNKEAVAHADTMKGYVLRTCIYHLSPTAHISISPSDLATATLVPLLSKARDEIPLGTQSTKRDRWTYEDSYDNNEWDLLEWSAHIMTLQLHSLLSARERVRCTLREEKGRGRQEGHAKLSHSDCNKGAAIIAEWKSILPPFTYCVLKKLMPSLATMLYGHWDETTERHFEKLIWLCALYIQHAAWASKA